MVFEIAKLLVEEKERKSLDVISSPFIQSRSGDSELAVKTGNGALKREHVDHVRDSVPFNELIIYAP